jgi:hypothetical protein
MLDEHFQSMSNEYMGNEDKTLVLVVQVYILREGVLNTNLKLSVILLKGTIQTRLLLVQKPPNT